MKLLRLLSLSVATLLSLACSRVAVAEVIAFGSGTNQFNLEFMQVGSPNNADDMTGDPAPAGRVEYEYLIGKFEVNEDAINKFNALQGLQLTHDNRGANKPASSVSWNESARFVNWLNTSKGYQAAYNFTTSGGNDNISLWSSSDAWQLGGENLFRHKDAHYWLPSLDEWYKASFYDPTTGDYFDYSTGSNTAPIAISGGTAPGTVVYDQLLGTGPADITNAGGLSPCGVMGLGGNVYEWEESELDLQNDSPTSDRGGRGGVWFNSIYNVSSVARIHSFPTDENFCIGLRVAGLAVVPEPSSLILLSLSCMSSVLYRGQRLRK